MPCKGRAKLLAWIDTYGLHAYEHFLITHPRYTVREWLEAWDLMQGSLWSLDSHPSFYAAEQVRAKKLNDLIFNFPGAISLHLAILLVFCGIIVSRRNPVIFFCLMYTALVGILSFHGDGEEVVRHAQQPMMALKIAFLLCVLHLYTLVKTHFCQESLLNDRRRRFRRKTFRQSPPNQPDNFEAQTESCLVARVSPADTSEKVLTEKPA
jgi:hypothetical protein